MKHLGLIFLTLSSGAAVSLAQAEVDARALVKQSVANYDRDWREAMSWAYTQTDTTHSDGSTTIEISHIAPLAGTPYERLVLKNGHPLSGDEKSKEDKKYQKALRERKSESASDRAARIHKYETERAFIHEIPNAYDFKVIGEENVSGRPAYILQMTPHPGYVPKTSRASMLKHIEGKLYVDKQDVQWAKAEAHVVETVSIGWILARIGPGARITLDQERVAPNLWVPKKITINGTAKVMMVHTKNLNETLTFADYRKSDGKAPQGVAVAERER